MVFNRAMRTAVGKEGGKNESKQGAGPCLHVHDEREVISVAERAGDVCVNAALQIGAVIFYQIEPRQRGIPFMMPPFHDTYRGCTPKTTPHS